MGVPASRLAGAGMWAVVGRPPWSAADAPVGLPRLSKGLILRAGRASVADAQTRGSAPRTLSHSRYWEKYVALGNPARGRPNRPAGPARKRVRRLKSLPHKAAGPVDRQKGWHLAGRVLLRDGSTKYVAEREFYMTFALSVVGGLFLVGYAFSRMNARKGAKKNVQTIFDQK